MVSGDRLIGHVSINNAGNLPATNVRWFIRIKSTPNGQETSFETGDLKGSIVVAPHSATTLACDETIILQARLDASDAGKGREHEKPLFIYVWGLVRYHDGFVGGRSTEFCHRYNWINRPNRASAYEIDAKFARQHTEGNVTS